MSIFKKCIPCLWYNEHYDKLCNYDSNECELTDTYVYFRIKKSYFVDKIINFEINAETSALGHDHIRIGQYSIRFDYISHFLINNNAFYIFLYAEINEQKQIVYCDKPMFIKIVFPSYAYSSIYMKKLFKIINEYKVLNIHDTSANSFRSFKLKKNINYNRVNDSSRLE